MNIPQPTHFDTRHENDETTFSEFEEMSPEEQEEWLREQQHEMDAADREAAQYAADQRAQRDASQF